MVNWKSRKLGDGLWFANTLVAVVLLNIVVSHYFFRIDLTEEKRYSIKPQTKEILQQLEEEVYVEVFLEGDLNAGFTRFQKSIRETLEEFRIYSDNKVRFVFTDPAQAMSKKAQSEFMTDLAQRGIQPTNVIDKKDGQQIEKIIFPGAIVSVGGFETGVMLLKGSKARTSEEQINQSIEGVEYELIQAIYALTNTERKQIGLVTGHGELDSTAIVSFVQEASLAYDVVRVNLANTKELNNMDALVIAKPTKPYTPVDKFILDQYIMQGGKVLFMMDKLEASMDSASRDDYYAFPYETNLDDQLFRYGVRINLDLLQDRTSGLYPIITGNTGSRPQMQLMDWPFYPLINQYGDHTITRNLDAVLTRFVSSVDTVKAVGVKKTPLMKTSYYARSITAPVPVSVNELRKNIREEDFTKGPFPIGYLLEGTFTSLFKNRFAPEGTPATKFIDSSKPTRIVVIADGDLVRNEVNPRSGQPQALGFDPFTNYTFANRDLVMNILAYLTNDNGLIQARSKEVKIRPLDKDKIVHDRLFWQVVNIGAPLLLLVLFGVARAYWRKNKFAKF